MTTDNDPLNNLSNADIADILVRLMKDDPELAARVRQAAAEKLSDPVDIEEVAALVQMDLEFLDVEDLWARSGAQSDGYHEPCEEAYDMAKETLTEILDEMAKFIKLSQPEQTLRCCLGILRGLYLFRTESETEFKDWAEDVPSDLSDKVIRQWRKSKPSTAHEEKVQAFLAEKCPGFRVS